MVFGKVKSLIKRGKKKKEDLPNLDEMTDSQTPSYEEFVKESEMLSPEEAQAKISMLLTKPENLELMAELSKEEMIRLACLKTVADQYDNKFLHSFISNYLAFTVSLGRRGRGEVVEIARPSNIQRETMKRNLRDMLIGKR